MSGTRLRHFAAAVEALYQGTETWYVGARFIHANENALNRIVIAIAGGTIGEADTAAQGWRHSELSPRIVETANRRDDIVRLRRLAVDFHIWAADDDTAEARLCALVVALDALDQVEITGERWPTEEEAGIAHGGGYVVLTALLPLAVVVSDADPATTPGGPTYGQEQDTPDPVTITADLDGTYVPPVVIDPS